ncbi:MAG: hypothetical protein SOY42_12765 [Clostridium sp.]|nr:hypothetical protein [Clostridium sp.]
MITTILYSLLIFLIIGAVFTIISNNREDIKIEKKVNDNVNYFKNIDEIITNLNIEQYEIKYVLSKKKEKKIKAAFKLSFNEEENCFYLIPSNKEEYKMKLLYKNEGENYILYPYFLK